MLYVILLLIGFFVGWKFSNLWKALQLSIFKKEIDIQEIESQVNRKYKKEISNYKDEILKLQNKIDLILDIKKESEVS